MPLVGKSGNWRREWERFILRRASSAARVGAAEGFRSGGTWLASVCLVEDGGSVTGRGVGMALWGASVAEMVLDVVFLVAGATVSTVLLVEAGAIVSWSSPG